MPSIERIAQAAKGQAAPLSDVQPRSFHNGVTMTHYEGNSFSVKFNQSGARVLVDPWLVDDLVFFGQGWAYRGTKPILGRGGVDIDEVARETDLILLSQYLDDHTHMPTLERLPKTIPVVAQPQAANRIAPLGFKDVRMLDHGEEISALGGKLRVKATQGALTGPPWSKRQNGYLIREEAGEGVKRPVSMYYEPHADFEESSVREVAPVDVVVSPVKDVLLAGYALVKGDQDLEKLLRICKPTVLVPLLNAELDEEGGLTKLMSRKGDLGRLRQALQDMGLGAIDVDLPAPPGEAFSIPL